MELETLTLPLLFLLLIVYVLGQNITCDENKDCMIDCTESQYICADMEIIATHATSLSLTCGSYGCIRSKIFCPNDFCHIDCFGSNACNQVAVYSEILSKINITSDANKGFDYGVIYAPHKTNQLFLNCFSSQSCQYTEIYSSQASNINIICDGKSSDSSYYEISACLYMYLNASFAKNIEIVCNDAYSCYLVTLSANNAANISIIVNDSYFAGNQFNIYARNASNFNLVCVGSVTNNGCYNLRLWSLPDDSSRITINCFGLGCSFMPRISIVYGFRSLAESVINFNGCGVCQTPDECIDSWKIYCGSPNYYYFREFYGDSCGFSQNDYCNCLSNTDLITNIFINNVTHYFDICKTITLSPTISPTPQPTISPTQEPTAYPSISPIATLKPTISPSQQPTQSQNSKSVSYPFNIGRALFIVLSTAILIVLIVLFIFYFVKCRSAKKRSSFQRLMEREDVKYGTYPLQPIDRT